MSFSRRLPTPLLPGRSRRLAVLAALLFAAQAASARPFRNFAFYYGYGRLEELASYDLVVLQPWAYNAPDIAGLKGRGVTALAYISVGEDDTLRRDNGRGPGGYAPWYLDEFTGSGFEKPGADGRPDENPGWKSYYVDPSHRRWRKHLRNRLKEVRAQGFDGLFLDTALIPRNAYTIDVERKKLERGMDELLKALCRDWPEGYFLINNGWEFLEKEKISADGILLEGVLSHDAALPPDDRGEASRLARLINHHRARRPLDAFSLDYVPIGDESLQNEICREADEFGLSAVLYPDDELGSGLKRFPIRKCGPK